MDEQTSEISIQPVFLREIAVGEPELRNLPTFAVEAFERQGSHHINRKERLAKYIGEDAARWLLYNAIQPWTFAERVHRPRHPREVQRQYFILFASVDDAERFGWANGPALTKARLADMSGEVCRHVADLRNDVEARRFDAHGKPLRQSLRRMEDLRHRMRQVAGILRRADDLMRQECVRYKVSHGWLRRAAEPLTVPRVVKEAIRSDDLSDHSRLLAELQEDVDYGWFSFSLVEEQQWIDRVNEFIWRARRVRKSWRLANQRRRAQGLEPDGEPFKRLTSRK